MARRILVVRLDAVGDVLMTTPAIRALAASGDVELTLLTSSAGAAVAPMLPDIARTIVHDPAWMKAQPRAGGVEEDAIAERDLIERLRAEAFDGAVIFTVHTQSALPAAFACTLAGIPLRLAHARENAYRLLTDQVVDPETVTPLRHEVRRQLDLVAAIGAEDADEHLSVRVPPDAARSVRRVTASLGLDDGRPWAVVHPGASAASRRYPAARFAAVARALVRDHGWRVLVTGSTEEALLVDTVAEGLGDAAIPLAGRFDLAELAALLAIAPVLIANNSGPAHLAAAVGTPVVELYALTNLQHAPWGVISRVLANDVPCKECRRSVCPMGHHACLLGVPAGDVVAAAVEVVRRGAGVAMPPAGILAPRMAPAGTPAPKGSAA